MDFPPDIKLFVEQRFDPGHRSKIWQVLGAQHMCTPRIMRSVLFLSNGSISLLDYFADLAKSDVRHVVLQAEYETEIAEHPLWLRDMNLPFTHERNLGAGALKTIRARPPRAAAKAPRYHKHLVDQQFVLGEARYTVLPRQNHANHVLCRRRVATNKPTQVRLPVTFVADLLAEHVELSAVAGDHFDETPTPVVELPGTAACKRSSRLNVFRRRARG